MKAWKLLLGVGMFLIMGAVSARTLHSGPSYTVTYTDASGVTYGVTTLIRTDVTPYGETDTLVVHIKNNKIYYFQPSVVIADGQFTADGCGQPLAVGQTCDVTVTWSPVGVSDGTIHTTNSAFTIYNYGSPYVTLTIQGLAE